MIEYREKSNLVNVKNYIVKEIKVLGLNLIDNVSVVKDLVLIIKSVEIRDLKLNENNVFDKKI